MNGLEKLVPLLSECKQIPAGEFADSALVHAEIWESIDFGDEERPAYSQTVMLRTNAVEYKDKAEDVGIANVEITAAPTLVEIFNELREYTFSQRVSINGTRLFYIGTPKVDDECDENPATSALRLWFKINKIEK